MDTSKKRARSSFTQNSLDRINNKNNDIYIYIYIYNKNCMEKTIKEPLELELTSRNKNVTLTWENRVKGLIKIALKKNKMLKIKLNVPGLQV